jgi:hypothetical protein|nr:MAG TPA_asm: head to tail adaptor [Caudoviricetes sp.]
MADSTTLEQVTGSVTADDTITGLTLSQVEEAITAIMEGGQSYKIGTRSLTRANLTELVSLRNQLKTESNDASAEASGIPGCSIALFSGR